MNATTDIERIERALVQSVYCDDCTWKGVIHQCRSTLNGWLVCPVCQSQQIFEAPRTLH